MNKNVPNIITASRFLFGILMGYFSFIGEYLFFILAYGFSLLSDILDGFVARRFHLESDFGKKFDIIADNFIVICIILATYFFVKELFFLYLMPLLCIFAYFLIVQAISLFSRKSLIFQRTYAANLAAIVFPIAVIFLIFFKSGNLIYLYSLIMIYSLTEKLFLKMAKTSNVSQKSIFLIKSRYKLIFLAVFFLVAGAFFVLFILPMSDNASKACFDDNYCINLEVKDTFEEREVGLMYREYLDENQGMLFIFEQASRYTFWMKNMKMPIDIIYLDKDFKIVSIFEDVPACSQEPCELYTPDLDSLYVIETKAGFSTRHNVKVGQLVKITIGKN